MIVPVLIAALLLVFVIRYGREVYIMVKYPEPETYIEDYSVHTDYCNNLGLCVASLVCKIEQMDCPAGCIPSCSNRSGSTRALRR